MNSLLPLYLRGSLRWWPVLLLLALWTPAFWQTTGRSTAGTLLFWQSFVVSAMLWPLCWALFGRLWIALLVCFPAALWLPMELWLRISHGTPISAHIVALIAETNWAEGHNFLTAYGAPLLLAWLYWVLLYAIGTLTAHRHQLLWRHKSRRWVLVIGLPLLGMWVVQSTPAAVPHQASLSDLLKDSGKPSWGSELATIFPSNVVVAVVHYQEQEQKLQALRIKLHGQRLEAKLLHEQGPEIVVLIIGESASATRWSMLGYERETTPLLQSTSGWIGFTDVLALSGTTRTAIPGAIAEQPVLHPNGSLDLSGSPSVMQAFREAGYQTHWISNQAPLGLHDTAITLYAQEAHHVRFLNPGTYDQRTSYDAELLGALKQALEHTGKHFVVLHLMGSHFDYAWRYPEEFDHFQPSSQATALPSPEHVNNSYDNSIRYTDFIIDSTAKVAAQRSSRAAVVYFSDHGVDPAIGPCHSGNAGRNTEASYRVPVAIWLSPAQQKQTAELWQQLQHNQHQPYTTRAVYGSLLELAGIGTAKQPHLETFLTPPLHPKTRWVAGAGGRMVNFEETRQRGLCRIANG